MSLRLSLLCVLTARPMTGYELAKQFDSSASYLWYAEHSQIYPELRRMESEGLVIAREMPRGRAQKRVYQITEDGRHTVRMGLTAPAESTPLRDADYLKASYLEFVDDDDARLHFVAHKQRHESDRARFRAVLQRLDARDIPLLRDRLENSPPEHHGRIVAYKLHVYRGLIARAESEIRWAEQGLDLVDRLAQANVDEPD